jgi:hypothetical protein
MAPMQDARSIRFATIVQCLTRAARAAGWQLPSFRSPPAVAGASRTIRRRPDGSRVVAVQLHGRPWNAVVADLIEGVVVANGLRDVEADHCRSVLWDHCAAELHPAVAA